MEVSGEILFGIFIILVIAVLVALGNLDTEEFIRVLMVIIGLVFGTGYGYTRGYLRGRQA